MIFRFAYCSLFSFLYYDPNRERRIFLAWNDFDFFLKELDEPPKEIPELKKLFEEKSVFEYDNSKD